MSNTYIDFTADLERLNKQLESKMQELPTLQRKWNEVQKEYDTMVAKKSMIGGRLNVGLGREIKYKEVDLKAARNDVTVCEQEITRMQEERNKIRSMLELKNVSNENKNYTAATSGDVNKENAGRFIAMDEMKK